MAKPCCCMLSRTILECTKLLWHQSVTSQMCLMFVVWRIAAAGIFPPKQKQSGVCLESCSTTFSLTALKNLRAAAPPLPQIPLLVLVMKRKKKTTQIWLCMKTTSDFWATTLQSARPLWGWILRSWARSFKCRRVTCIFKFEDYTILLFAPFFWVSCANEFKVLRSEQWAFVLGVMAPKSLHTKYHFRVFFREELPL